MAEFDDITEKFQEYDDRILGYLNLMGVWATGSATGGPNGDGLYPLPAGAGATIMRPSPEKSRVDAARFGIVTLTGAGPHTLTLAQLGSTIRVGNGTATPNIGVRLPNLPAGSQFMFKQIGSGRIAFSTVGGITPVHRQNYLRTAGLYAIACAMCDEVVNGNSVWTLGGDLST